MACKSLTTYSKDCKKTTGGVSELYLISYGDLTNVEGSLENYETDETGNLISEIGLATGKNFVKVGLIKNTVGVVEDYVMTPETNSFEINTTLNLVVSNVSVESRTFVNGLLDAGEVAAIVKLRSGKYIALGLEGFLEVSAINGGSGTAGADLNGYTITLSGVENDLIRLVDPTIIATLITPSE